MRHGCSSGAVDARSKTITVFKSRALAAGVTDRTSYFTFPTVARNSDAGGTTRLACLLGNTKKLVSRMGFGTCGADMSRVPAAPAKRKAAGKARPATHP